MNFIPSTRAINAMCKLLADYKALADTRETLADLRQELGENYPKFERELQRQLYQVPAWKAVSNIISAAVRRKQAALLKH